MNLICYKRDPSYSVLPCKTQIRHLIYDVHACACYYKEYLLLAYRKSYSHDYIEYPDQDIRLYIVNKISKSVYTGKM